MVITSVRKLSTGAELAVTPLMERSNTTKRERQLLVMNSHLKWEHNSLKRAAMSAKVQWIFLCISRSIVVFRIITLFLILTITPWQQLH